MLSSPQFHSQFLNVSIPMACSTVKMRSVIYGNGYVNIVRLCLHHISSCPLSETFEQPSCMYMGISGGAARAALPPVLRPGVQPGAEPRPRRQCPNHPPAGPHHSPFPVRLLCSFLAHCPCPCTCTNQAVTSEQQHSFKTQFLFWALVSKSKISCSTCITFGRRSFER